MLEVLNGKHRRGALRGLGWLSWLVGWGREVVVSHGVCVGRTDVRSK